ncbi:hypothetical protein D4Q76_00275 [archaeon]|nr:MAG: hypothetical protein D4Q76_00275 [archaeon]
MKLKRKIPKEEIIADLVFFAVAVSISLAAIFAFDIHWSLYPGSQIFSKFVFEDKGIYLYGGLVGGIAGFFIIKILMFGFMEEEKAASRKV